jgi:transposase-like protein
MAETRRKFEQDFKEGAVRLVRETGKPIAQVARELGIHDGTLGNWVNADRPGIPPWSSSCVPGNPLLPRQSLVPGSRPGSTSTTGSDVTRP